MWQPVSERGSLSERIVAQVEQMLQDQRLKPGDRLPAEREMARMLAVSRTSVREAIRTLQARGRLVVKHGQGVFVEKADPAIELRSAVSRAEHGLAELFAMREVLEVPAATWAAEKITPDELGRLRGLLDELDAEFEAGMTCGEPDFERLAGLDAAFHLGIAAACGNQFLRQTSHVLHDMLMSGMETTLLIPGRREKSRREHVRILEALASGDGAAAGRAARAHIRSARAAAMGRMAREKQGAEPATRTVPNRPRSAS
ncbi:MAG TPA: FCD domain-containing protein [Actinopolymorphaceae bacterium]